MQKLHSKLRVFYVTGIRSSADREIEKHIRHFLLQEPEFPIVIPFQFKDFASFSAGLIMSAVRKNYLIRDLFGYESPLRQDYFFFGRSNIVEDVIDRHRAGQNSSLFGLRKSGKTSTIYAIQRRAKTNGIRPILIDCQDPNIHARTYVKLLQFIIEMVRSELSLKKISVDLGDQPDKVSSEFKRLMSQTLGEAGIGVLLIFDEIENISPRTAASPHWRNERDTLLFWQTLRTFFQSYQKNRMTLCFVGTNPSLLEMTKIDGVDNPVYLFAPKSLIPMLTFEDTREMVRKLGYFMGLDFDDSVVAFIHEKYGGHPFFIRQICSRIHKMAGLVRPVIVSLGACVRAEREVATDIKSYLQQTMNSLQQFYPEQLEMLSYLANNQGDEFQKMATSYPDFVEHLVGYGLVTRRGDEYEFSIGIVSDLFRKVMVESEASTNNDRRQIIGRRRNALEEEIRTWLYHWGVRIGYDMWKSSVLRALTKRRLEQVGEITVREAFSRNKSKLYWMELYQFIKISGSINEEIVPLTEIGAAFEVINSTRIDAHAGDISEDDFREAIRALDLLESVFLPP
jgi:hypothetical protein